MRAIIRLIVLIGGADAGNPGGGRNALLLEDNESGFLLEDGTDILLEG